VSATDPATFVMVKWNRNNCVESDLQDSSYESSAFTGVWIAVPPLGGSVSY
jgi:hypothetical protein